MKRKFLLILALVFSSALVISAQEAEPGKEPAWVIDFNNLPESKRKEFADLFQDATRMFNQKRVFECLQTLKKSENIFPDHPQTKNLMGACFVEFRDFEKANSFFQRALELSPGNMSVRFNKAEVAFVRGFWEKAAEQLKGIVADMRGNSDQSRHLCEFKIFISLTKLGKTEEAEKYGSLYDEEVDSPFYYMVKAVRSFEEGDKTAAQSWLRSANAVFGRHAASRQQLMAFNDAMIESNYLESFYGGEDE